MNGTKTLFSLILFIVFFSFVFFAHSVLAFQTISIPSVTSSSLWSQSRYPVTKAAYLQNIESSGSYVVALILQRLNTANSGTINFDIIQNGVTIDTITTVNTSGGVLSSVGRSAYFIPFPLNYDSQYDIEIVPQLPVSYTTALYSFGPETIDNTQYPVVWSDNQNRRFSSAVILASTTSSGGDSEGEQVNFNDTTLLISIIVFFLFFFVLGTSYAIIRR